MKCPQCNRRFPEWRTTAMDTSLGERVCSVECWDEAKGGVSAYNDPYWSEAAEDTSDA